LRIFNRFFTHLLYVLIHARLQIFIQLSPILTKLCHIERDYQCWGVSVIHVSWCVLYVNSIKYQVSWYIFGTVSVSMIHFRCISMINQWYMIVIHLRRTTKKTAAVNSSPGVSATVSRIQSMLPIVTNCEVEDDFFDYGTIPSTDAAINAVDSLTGNVSTSWSDTWTENAGKIQSISESFRLHQLIAYCSARLDTGQRKVPRRNHLSDSMFEKLSLLKANHSLYRTEVFYWHYYLCFYLMAIILQPTFDANCMWGCWYYCACIFVLLCL